MNRTITFEWELDELEVDRLAHPAIYHRPLVSRYDYADEDMMRRACGIEARFPLALHQLKHEGLLTHG
jgi:hypothetical protein